MCCNVTELREITSNSHVIVAVSFASCRRRYRRLTITGNAAQSPIIKRGIIPQRIHIHRASGPRFVSFPRDLLKRTNVREVVTSVEPHGRQSMRET